LPPTVSTIGTPCFNPKSPTCCSGKRIAHTAAGDDEGPFRGLQEPCRLLELLPIRPRPRDVPDCRFEPNRWIIKGLLLRVLAKRNESRAAIGRIEHGGDRLWQRRDDLRGQRDAVPVATDGLEGVVDGYRRVAEMLDLLEHRIGHSIRECITC
jgi:hypothetical protein